MKILITKPYLNDSLKQVLEDIKNKSHQTLSHIDTNYLMDVLQKLLGIDIRGQTHEKLEGYVLFAHLSNYKFFLSLDKNSKVSVLSNGRNDFDLDDQNALYSLDGWKQIVFLPILSLFLLRGYIKNSFKKNQLTTLDFDRDALNEVLFDELWIAINAFRIKAKYEEAYNSKNDNNLQTVLSDFTEDLKELKTTGEIIQVVFPCGITDQHATYIGFVLFEGEYDILFYNAGLYSEKHYKEDINGKRYIFPLNIGRLKSDNDYRNCINYLKTVCNNTYIEKSMLKKMEKKEIDSKEKEMMGGSYNIEDRFHLNQNESHPASLDEPKPRIPCFEMQSLGNCVTHNYMAGLYCRNSTISKEVGEIENIEDSLYALIYSKLLKFSVTYSIETQKILQKSRVERYQELRIERIKTKIKAPEPFLQIDNKFPQYNNNFIKRKESSVLFTRLQQPSNGSVTLVCCGIDGFGKSEIVIDYAYEHKYKYKAIRWINAQDTKSIEISYVDLANNLGLTIKNKTIDNVVADLNNWFEHNPRCLLIFDNAPHLDDPNYGINKYIPKLNCDVIITTPISSTYANGSDISIGTYTPEEARAYVRKFLINQSNYSDEKIDELARTLSYVPLALAQACAFINSKKLTMDINKYIESYTSYNIEVKKEVLMWKTLSGGRDHLPVYITWDIAFNAISQESPSAEKLLHLCAYLHNEDIPLFLLEHLIKNEIKTTESENVDLVVSVLTKYSILYDDINKKILIHRLVQDVIQLKLKEAKQDTNCIRILILSLNALFTYNKYQDDNWKNIRKVNPLYEQLLPHLYDLLSKIEYISITPEISHELLIKVISYIADVKSNYHGAGILIKNLEQLHQSATLNQNYLAKAELLREKANLLLQLDGYPEAIKNFEEAKKIYENNFLKDSKTRTPFSAVIHYQLGHAYFSQGNYEKANENYNQTITIHKDIDPAQYKSPNVAIALRGLGNIFLVQGQYTDAEAAYNEALTIYKSLLMEGEEHRDIAIINGDLAQLNYECKKYNDALSKFQIAHRIYSKIYGSDNHIDVAIIFYNISHVLYNLDKLDEALEKVQESLKIYEKIYKGFFHIDMIVIEYRMGFLLCKKGEYAQGILKYQQALDIYDKVTKEEKQEKKLINLRARAKHYSENKENEKSVVCYLLLLECIYTCLKQKGTRIVQLKVANKKNNAVLHPRNEETEFLQLLEACSNGNIKRVKELHSKVANINGANSLGITPLYAAAKKGDLAVVKCLVEAGKAQFELDKATNEGIENPLLVASQYGHFDVIDYLIEFKMAGIGESISYLAKLLSKIKKDSPKKNFDIWKDNPSYVIVSYAVAPDKRHQIAAAENINKFFSENPVERQLAIEYLIKLQAELIPMLHLLHTDREEKKTLGKGTIIEIILKLYIIDPDIISFILEHLLINNKNSIFSMSRGSCYIPPSKNIYKSINVKDFAIEFLKLIGIKNEFLEICLKENFSTNDPNKITVLINRIMRNMFIFDPKYNQSITSSLGELSETSLEILIQFTKIIGHISQIILQKEIVQTQLSILLGYLKHEYAIVRLAAKNALLKLKLLDNGIVQQALIDNYSNNNWKVRRDSIELLGELAFYNPKVISHFIQALSDPNEVIRLSAASVLIKANQIDEKILQVIREGLTHNSPNIQLNAIEISLNLSRYNQIIINSLVPLIVDYDNDVKQAAIDAVKKIEKFNHSDVLSAISQYFLQSNTNKITSDLINLLLEWCTKEDTQIGLGLIKYVPEHRYRQPSIIKGLTELEERYKDQKAIFDLLIKETNWLSIYMLFRVVNIFPSFELHLFSLTIESPTWFPIPNNYNYKGDYCNNCSGLKELVNKFPERCDKLLSKTLDYTIWLSATVKNLQDLIYIIECFPSHMDKIFEKVVTNHIWFTASVKNCEGAIYLVKLFPNHASFFYTKLLENPDWFSTYVKDVYSLTELVTNFPQQRLKLFDRFIKNAEWSLLHVKNTEHLDKLVIIFPDQNAELYERFVNDPEWSKLNIKDTNSLKNVVSIFPKKHLELFERFIKNEEWCLLYINNTDHLINLLSVFPEHNIEIFIRFAENPIWISSNVKGAGNLSKLVKAFPDKNITLYENIVKNSKWCSLYVTCTQHLEELVKIFPDQSAELYERFVNRYEWSKSNIKDTNSLKSVVSSFPTKRLELFENYVKNPEWSKLYIKSVPHLVDLAITFPDQDAELFDRFIKDPEWSKLHIKDINSLKSIVSIFPIKRLEIFENYVKNSEWCNLCIKGTHHLVELVTIFPEHNSELFETFIKNHAWITSNVKDTYKLGSLVKAFSKQCNEIFKLFIKNPAWILLYVKDEFDLKELAAAFAEQRSELLIEIVQNLDWISSYMKNLNRLTNFIELFPNELDTMFEKIVRNPVCLLAFVKDIQGINNLAKIFKVQKKELCKCFCGQSDLFNKIVVTPENLRQVIQIFTDGYNAQDQAEIINLLNTSFNLQNQKSAIPSSKKSSPTLQESSLIPTHERQASKQPSSVQENEIALSTLSQNTTGIPFWKLPAIEINANAALKEHFANLRQEGYCFCVTLTSGLLADTKAMVSIQVTAPRKDYPDTRVNMDLHRLKDNILQTIKIKQSDKIILKESSDSRSIQLFADPTVLRSLHVLLCDIAQKKDETVNETDHKQEINYQCILS